SFGDRYKGPDEHPGVPAVLSAADIFESLVEIGLFDELFRAGKSRLVTFDPLRRRQRFAHANITVAGSRFGRLDADGDNCLPAAGQIKGIAENLLEFFFLRDDVI